MEEQCPVCKITKTANPNLKFMVNACGHQLCTNCVDMLFLKGFGACPQCKTALRRNNFRIQLFENPDVDKEMDIRRRVMKDFNKMEEDFASEAEYMDYLEQIEEIVYNLTNNIDVIETNKLIESYKRENREQINRNRVRVNADIVELEALVQAEKAQQQQRERELAELELQSKLKQQRAKEDLIMELIKSEENAAEIVSNFDKIREQQTEESKKLPPPKPMTEFSTGIKLGTAEQFLPLPKTDEGVCYVYQPLVLETLGPAALSEQEIKSKNLLRNVRTETAAEAAGGFRSVMACKRALDDAFQGLYFFKSK